MLKYILTQLAVTVFAVAVVCCLLSIVFPASHEIVAVSNVMFVFGILSMALFFGLKLYSYDSVESENSSETDTAPFPVISSDVCSSQAGPNDSLVSDEFYKIVAEYKK